MQETRKQAFMRRDFRPETHPENSSAIVDLDLEAQILRAEQAVIQRDQRVRARGAAFVERLENGLLRHAGKGVIVGVGTLALLWWFGRLDKWSSVRPPPDDAQEHIARDAGLSIASLLPLIWPWMPAVLRARVTPAMVTTVLTFAMPLLGQLFRRTRRAQSTADEPSPPRS